MSAAANMFSTISFCGDDAFLLHPTLFRAKSKSRENQFTFKVKTFFYNKPTSKKDTRSLPNFTQFTAAFLANY